MCLALILGTREPVGLIPFDTDAPGFNITALTPHEEPVRAIMQEPEVCSVGAHTGCGCGFRSLNVQPEGGHLPQEYAVVEEPEKSALDHAALARFLEELLQRESGVTLYPCWHGEWTEPVLDAFDVTPKTIADDAFFFKERCRYRVVPGNSAGD